MSGSYLITPALPYANGPIHLGHMLEHIQVSILVNALRMNGDDVLCVCGSDSHGTAIEINASKKNTTPEEFSKKWQILHEKSFKKFHITYDGGYGQTHTKENEYYLKKIFTSITKLKQISKVNVKQFFDNESFRFLPDRFIMGKCPKCKTNDQYGDYCESCGATYEAIDLIDPKSILSGSKPVLKDSKHYFFNLADYAVKLEEWLSKNNILQDDIKNFLKIWFKNGLKKWDISRDEPYFGFKIPGEKNKYFYVWLDAPVGYISLTELAAKKINKKVKDYWNNKDTNIIHVIGKDIVYFHTLFWPAMLMSSGYNLPKLIHVHGMLTIDGKKMSKSRNTFFLADDYAEYLNPETLRYYFASKLNSTTEDLNFNLKDLKFKVNSDLVNKIVNIISRTVSLLNNYKSPHIGNMDKSFFSMINKIKIITEKVKKNYLLFENSKAVKGIVEIAEITNKYLQNVKPWETIKTNKDIARNQLTTALWSGKVCVGLLKPILPKMAKKCEQILNENNEYNFKNILNYITPGRIISKYEKLFERITDKNIKLLDDKCKK